jgi:hypothetical protein
MTYLADLYHELESLRRQHDALLHQIFHAHDCGREPEEELVLAAKAFGDEYQAVDDRIKRAEVFGEASSADFTGDFLGAAQWDIDPPVYQVDRGGLGELVHQFHRNPSGLSAAVREGRAHLNLAIQFPANTLMIAVDSEDPEISSGPWVRWSKDDGWRLV